MCDRVIKIDKNLARRNTPKEFRLTSYALFCPVQSIVLSDEFL